MTDKQIKEEIKHINTRNQEYIAENNRMTQKIIDGVDVSGCNFSLERDGKIKCECTHATGFGVICDCESWKTCDYKNYKRKEQECEELKRIKDDFFKQAEISHEAVLNKNKIIEKLEKERSKYKQTLTEIKKISENVIKNVSDRCIETTPMYGVHKQILQKISEVEECKQ